MSHLKRKLRNNSGELQDKKGTVGPGKGKQTAAQGGSESGCCVEEDLEDKESQSWAFSKKKKTKKKLQCGKN